MVDEKAEEVKAEAPKIPESVQKTWSGKLIIEIQENKVLPIQVIAGEKQGRIPVPMIGQALQFAWQKMQNDALASVSV